MTGIKEPAESFKSQNISTVERLLAIDSHKYDVGIQSIMTQLRSYVPGCILGIETDSKIDAGPDNPRVPSEYLVRRRG